MVRAGESGVEVFANMMLEPEALPRYTEELKDAFNNSMKALGLKPFVNVELNPPTFPSRYDFTRAPRQNLSVKNLQARRTRAAGKCHFHLFTNTR